MVINPTRALCASACVDLEYIYLKIFHQTLEAAFSPAPALIKYNNYKAGK